MVCCRGLGSGYKEKVVGSIAAFRENHGKDNSSLNPFQVYNFCSDCGTVAFDIRIDDPSLNPG